eukprot:scaffold17296_cov145-Isochrysis_galbana.AAC.2
MIPLPWRERGIPFPQHKSKHTPQAHGDEARKAQGGGKRNLEPTIYTLCSEGGGSQRARPSHTPLSGA